MESSIEPLNVPNFNDLKVTTSVVVKRLEGNINLAVAFTCLPTTKSELEIDPKNKSITIPHYSAGTIISLRYMGEIRGLIVKSEKGGNFKNCIIIDMSVTDKNVNCRLSSSTIHICGVKNMSQADEAADLLIDHITKIQEELDYIKENDLENKNVIHYIESKIKLVNSKLIIDPNDNIDGRIFNFYCRNLEDHSSIESFLTELRWLASKDCIYNKDNNKPLRVCKTQISMINYNYDLGFKINRNNAYRELKQYKGLKVTYDNMLFHYIKIDVPFSIPQGSDILRKSKKGEPSKITIILYKSGSVTLSGSSFDINKKVYNRFNEIMAEIRPLIEADLINITERKKEEVSTSTEQEEYPEIRASDIVTSQTE